MLWEATLHLNCSKGIRPFQFFGHHFIRSVNLIGLPTLDVDKTVTVELRVDDDLNNVSAFTKGGGIVIQAVTLFTSPQGQRLVRVLTVRLPVTNNIIQIFNSTDCLVVANLFAKTSVYDLPIVGLKAVEEKILERLTNISLAFRKLVIPTTHLMIQLPECLQGLPLYLLALIKNPLLHRYSSSHLDCCSAFISKINVMPVDHLALFLYPRLMNLSNMSDKCGVPDDVDGNVEFPPNLNLNSSMLEFDDAVFLMDTGHSLILWVSRLGGDHMASLFGTDKTNEIDWSNVTLTSDPEEPKTSFKNRVCCLIHTLRNQKTHFQPLHIVNQVSVKAVELFSSRLVEDKTRFSLSYFDFVQKLHTRITKL
eukprot:TRINITY_DN19894_c0_g1_i1.p3 TRINITY_DN19894_c0_g1~~TRINITY_DN19894_c0_g1_i1.p3  ORF type:complete len:365 (+),score=66.64 TRINITY_DN19894_c0_g1_i1:3489-4583(+)